MTRQSDRVAPNLMPFYRPMESDSSVAFRYGPQHRGFMAIPPQDPFRPPRVLVVDADADNRERCRDWLTIAGWAVTQAEDGREALVKLVTLPSLLLTELRLPIIDGATLCEIVRRNRRMSALPILILTGETRATKIARATRAGADAVLIKPSTPDDVLDEMNRLLATNTTSAAG